MLVKTAQYSRGIRFPVLWFLVNEMPRVSAAAQQGTAMVEAVWRFGVHCPVSDAKTPQLNAHSTL